VLLVGGSGHVGSLITPYLRRHHELRVLDLQPPRHADIAYVAGTASDPAVVREALDGMDAFIYLVMRRGQGGTSSAQDIPTIAENYAANTAGLHLLLFLAQEMGVPRGVYTSTMSVHHRTRTWYPAEEAVPLDSPSVYGLTKGLGELICEYFAQWFAMNIIALRITGPRDRAHWLDERRASAAADEHRLYVTDEEDLARAYLAALEAIQIGHGRFDAIYIAGDEGEEEHNLSKAKRVLGWQPETHRSARP